MHQFNYCPHALSSLIINSYLLVIVWSTVFIILWYIIEPIDENSNPKPVQTYYNAMYNFYGAILFIFLLLFAIIQVHDDVGFFKNILIIYRDISII